MPGLVVVAGGKYTTYRVMAQDAVDAAGDRACARKVAGRAPTKLPLLGADGYRGDVEPARALAATVGLHPRARVEHLLNRYGSLIDELLELVAGDPALADAAARAPTTTWRVEVVYAATHEGALHLDDVLTRRTRISIETWDRGVGAAREAADDHGRRARLDRRARRAEVEHYRARVERRAGRSQLMPDDESADAARLEAREVVGGWTRRP